MTHSLSFMSRVRARMTGMAHDTTDAARAAQLAALRLLGPSGRVLLAAEMSEDARRIALEGMMRRHPELTEREAKRAMYARLWGATEP